MRLKIWYTHGLGEVQHRPKHDHPYQDGGRVIQFQVLREIINYDACFMPTFLKGTQIWISIS